MGPSNKKRKEAPLNCTLLDFFSSPNATKRAKVRTTSQSVIPRVRPSEVASRQVLVIDSDSDEDIHETDRARRAPNTEASADSNTQDKDTFGVPSALLRPPNLSHVCRTGQQFPTFSPEACRSEPAISVATKQTCISSCELLCCVPDDLTESRTGSELHADPVADSEPLAIASSIEDWAGGDDELVPEVLDSTRVGEDGPSDDQPFCPVCGIDLTGALSEAETHINQCLGTMSSQSDSSSLIATSLKANVGGSNTVFQGKVDLYSVLMASHKDHEKRAEADAIAADRHFKATRGNRRKAPFYKVLQGMPIAVDAFCYGSIPGVAAYFLTHAHSDHYTNLGSKWKNGPIYCSEETASLILHMLEVDPRWIHPLPMDTPTIIPNTGGVSVTLIDANHCPGSCILFFEGRQTIDAGDSSFKSSHVGSSTIFCYLHCGDFRAAPRHVLHPAVNGKHLDHIYLDTTYLDPKYTFSPQPLVISACAELARRLVDGGGTGQDPNAPASRNVTIDTWVKPSTSAETGEQQVSRERILVIVGTYSVGKERIVKAIAQALGTKIYCEPRKTAILRCQADKELHALLTRDPAEANVHIVPLGMITSDNLKSYLQSFEGTFSRVIGFRPTGWTFNPPSGSNNNCSIQSIIARGQSHHFSLRDLQPTQKSSYNIQIYGVPYSEHSSFFELTCFAMSCDWGRMIPTVNVGNPASRAKMTSWLKRWEAEKSGRKATIIQPRTGDYW